ncbi:MAG TPA: FecR family protein [bacterium]|nr:FecR family protein [bacterium]
MKRINAVIMIVLAALALAAPAIGQDEEECTAYVAGIVGDAGYRESEDAEWEPVELDMCLYIGDELRTKADSALALMFTEEIEVRVDAFSVFKVRAMEGEGEQPNSLDLKSGQAWAKVEKLEQNAQHSKFEIRTPTAIAGVRGTEFNVEVDEEGNSTVHVLDGTVSVLNELGEVLAAAGMMTKVFGGELPLDPEEFDIKQFQEKLNAWKDKISIGEIREAIKDEIKNNVKEKIDAPVKKLKKIF